MERNHRPKTVCVSVKLILHLRTFASLFIASHYSILAGYFFGPGTEQHRHNTTEVAVYSLLSYFWELEVGRPYVMTKASVKGFVDYPSLALEMMIMTPMTCISKRRSTSNRI